MSRLNLQTCKENCGCQCDYDVKACRDYDANIAHQQAHQALIQDAYDRRTAALLNREDE